MPDPSDRDQITDILIDHQLLKGGNCTCGYVYKLGETIQRHRADAILASWEPTEVRDLKHRIEMVRKVQNYLRTEETVPSGMVVRFLDRAIGAEEDSDA